MARVPRATARGRSLERARARVAGPLRRCVELARRGLGELVPREWASIARAAVVGATIVAALSVLVLRELGEESERRARVEDLVVEIDDRTRRIETLLVEWRDALVEWRDALDRHEAKRRRSR